MPRLQRDLVSLLGDVLPRDSVVDEEVAPQWLVRPGRQECGNVWPLVQAVYRTLSQLELPERMPARERRRLDAVITYPDGRQRVLEVDERQHFTSSRRLTLDFYASRIPTAFDTAEWSRRCEQLHGREPGGGFARPCLPLFPGAGGRHRQRAFRDFLADALPVAHGWLPTIRIADHEARPILASTDPSTRLGTLIRTKVAASQ